MPFTYARFWKCALQVNPESYNKVYRGEDHGLKGQEFLESLLTICRREGIEVVGLADHGSVQDVDAIRNYLTPHGIVVFPGFEVATTEKVHWVCLFHEETTVDQLNRYLGNLQLTDPKEGVRPSRLGGEEFLRCVEELGGFCYAAHATNESGVLKQKANHLWQNPRLRAAQIPGPVADLPQEYKSMALNQNPDYRREAKMAFINAKDVAKPEDLTKESASCYIKMTRPTFSSFITAFKDPSSRIRLHREHVRHYSRIKRVRVTSGYLDGIDIEFSDHLNAVISGRGAGKSTLLECIRYALDCDHIGSESRKQGGQIIKENLGKTGGRVELEIVSATNHMKTYRVVRRYGEPPRVVDDEGKESALHPKQDLVPGIEIYGQNEIYELARDQNAVVRILNRFLPDQTYHDGSFASLHKRLKENAGNLQKGLDQKDELEGELAKLPKLTEQVQQFKELGIEEKLKQVPLLEKERRLLPRMEDELKRLNEAVSTLEQALPDVKYLSDSSLDGLPHAELLGKGRSVLEKLRTEFDGGIKQLREAMTRADSQLKATVSETQTALKAAEERLESEFTKLPDVADKRGAEIGRAYQMLLREIERIQPKTSGLNTAQKLVDGLQQERRNLLGELSDMRSQRTGELETAIKKLNRRLRGKLQLKLVPNGNREGLDKFIRELPGIGGKKAAWVIEADDLTVPALVDSIRKGVDSIKKTGWRITGGVADTLTKLSVAQLMDLESIDLDDQVDVQLNVSHEAESYRSLAQLSTGQQCTAILHLLLLDNQDPLILDQPEDNLDNAFIAERIVQELRDAKTVRQFLFATHNANIPVFGDAEWIGVFSATENHGGIPEEGQGSIDISTIRDQAAEILEGGKVAFDQRKEMYGF